MAPAALEDRPQHQMFRTVLEDIAVTRLQEATERDRLRLLAELDRLPVAQRSEVGRFMLAAMEQVTSDPRDGIMWSLRTVRGRASHLGFGACSHPHTPEIERAFGLWAQLRHHDLLAITGDVDNLTTAAVLLTPRNDGWRPWDTTVAAVSGEVTFSPKEARGSSCCVANADERTRLI